jgi:hypothetical protein
VKQTDPRNFQIVILFLSRVNFTIRFSQVIVKGDGFFAQIVIHLLFYSFLVKVETIDLGVLGTWGHLKNLLNYPERLFQFTDVRKSLMNNVGNNISILILFSFGLFPPLAVIFFWVKLGTL